MFMNKIVKFASLNPSLIKASLFSACIHFEIYETHNCEIAYNACK